MQCNFFKLYRCILSIFKKSNQKSEFNQTIGTESLIYYNNNNTSHKKDINIVIKYEKIKKKKARARYGERER